MRQTVCAYTRVSTADQAQSGAGLGAQRSAIEGEALRRGWDVDWYEDPARSGSTLRREVLIDCLRTLERQPGAVLVVARLDRLTRSLSDLATLLERSRKHNWQLVILDLNIDTTTPSGELIANVVAALSQWERRMISIRTREALAERKASGVQLGRPRLVPPDVVARIVALDAAGQGQSAIARVLDSEGVPTPNGAVHWYPNTVRRILASEVRRAG